MYLSIYMYMLTCLRPFGQESSTALPVTSANPFSLAEPFSEVTTDDDPARRERQKSVRGVAYNMIHPKRVMFLGNLEKHIKFCTTLC